MNQVFCYSLSEVHLLTPWGYLSSTHILRYKRAFIHVLCILSVHHVRSFASVGGTDKRLGFIGAAGLLTKNRIVFSWENARIEESAEHFCNCFPWSRGSYFPSLLPFFRSPFLEVVFIGVCSLLSSMYCVATLLRTIVRFLSSIVYWRALWEISLCPWLGNAWEIVFSHHQCLGLWCLWKTGSVDG